MLIVPHVWARRRTIAAAVLITFAWLLIGVGSSTVQASNLTVTRFDDPVPDGCVADDCSLREAIIAANANAGPDIIELAEGTYTLSLAGRFEDDALKGDLDIRDRLVITGMGADTTTISAGGATTAIQDRVFDVLPNAFARISELTVRDGFVRFPPLDCGGGIRNYGDLELTKVFISDNVMRGSGGGVCNEGHLIVADSTITGNCACFAGFGGGLYNTGTAEIDNTTMTENKADSLGGGIHGTNLTIADSTISENEGRVGAGGGGISAAANVTITNTTVSGNKSADEFGFTPGRGGGVLVLGNGDVTLVNATITGNVTDGSGGGIFTCQNRQFSCFFGGTVPGLVTMRNTITANNAPQQCSGPVSSTGYNLSTDGTCSLTGPGDLPNTHPLLGPLADSGGPTATHALPPGSPAVDAGDNSACPVTDQRGFSRPFDGDVDGAAVCDIGAYELHNCIADVNGDGVVDLHDLTAVARSMGSRPGSTRWNAAADITGDGVVNIADLSRVLEERHAKGCT